MLDYQRIIGGIYDCAANPELWAKTLNEIRDHVGVAYVMVGLADFSPMLIGSAPTGISKFSDWDERYVHSLNRFISTIPQVDKLYQDGVDAPWIQMEHVTEAEFHTSDFYQQWVKPQKLRDCLVTLYMKRPNMVGVLSMASSEGTPLLGDRERQIANLISPHVRRAMAINDLVDKGKLALAMYRQVLDSLSVAVFVVGSGGTLRFANGKADELLRAGDLVRLAGGKLAANRSDITSATFDEAIARAIKGDEAMGISGIGVPLVGLAGERAAAYVLPLSGKDVRGEIGRGHAAVFIARRSEQQPMAIEILRTVFDLTPVEAKVAFAISLGDGVETVSIALGNTVNTVRAHLKSIYLKANVADKTALAAKVASVIPPLTTSDDKKPVRKTNLEHSG